MNLVSRDETEVYRTKDGSLVREIVHPDRIPVRNLSLAEARLESGAATAPHYQDEAEEIYCVIAGTGILMIAGEQAAIGLGQAALIPPRARHRIANTGAEDLVFLCLSSPPYTHRDTVLGEDET